LGLSSVRVAVGLSFDLFNFGARMCKLRRELRLVALGEARGISLEGVSI